MGTDNYPRVMMGLLVAALLGASLIIVMLLTLLSYQRPPSPAQAMHTPTAVPRLLEEAPPQSAPQLVILVESQMSKTITAQKILAVTTPVVLEPVYGE